MPATASDIRSRIESLSPEQQAALVAQFFSKKIVASERNKERNAARANDAEYQAKLKAQRAEAAAARKAEKEAIESLLKSLSPQMLADIRAKAEALAMEKLTAA